MKRLFYVGITRAEDHLVLSGMQPSADGIPATPEAGKSRMDWLLASLGGGDDAIAAGEIGYVDACGTPCSIRVVTDPAAIAAAERQTTPDLPAPETLASPREKGFERPPWTSGHPAGRQRAITVSRLAEGEPGKRRMLRLFPAPAGEDAPAREGIILHDVMAGVPAATALARGGRGDDDEGIRQLEAAREAFFSLPIVRDAADQWCEVPFSVEIAGRHCTGRIDRLIRTGEEKWVVIDYKSGSWEEGAEDTYTRQMTMYHAAVTLLTGVEPDCFLWFAGNGLLVPVAPDRDDLMAAIRRTPD